MRLTARLPCKLQREDKIMYPNREFRFCLATLNPFPQLNEAARFIAIQRAIGDARAEGRNPDIDHGVRLLRMRCATANSTMSSHQMEMLSDSCKRRLSEIRAEPILALLASRDIGADSTLKNWFHAEARKALVAMADCAGITDNQYDLRHRLASKHEPGSTYLIGKGYHIEVTAGRKYGANVGLYQTLDRTFIRGDRPRWRSLLQLLDGPEYGKWLKDQIDLMTIDTRHEAFREKLDHESCLNQSDGRTGQ